MTEPYCQPITRESAENVPPDRLMSMYTAMLKIRLTEERIAELITRKEILCPCHLYIGQEAVAAGVCETLRKEDYVFSTHRSHGHYLAKGGGLKPMMAELYGRETGCSRGQGGSMHLVAPEVGFPGSSAIVAGTIPLAVGAALAFALQHRDAVSVAFFGDGATDEGGFYESLNFAALKKLPVIFVCENNLYSTHLHISARQPDGDIYKRAAVFNMPGIRMDGNNAVEVFKSAGTAVGAARQGNGPVLLECMTYRWRGHVGPNWDLDTGIRTKAEVESWVNNCPISRMRKFLLGEGIVSAKEDDQMVKELRDEIEAAVAYAKESPFPSRKPVQADKPESRLFAKPPVSEKPVPLPQIVESEPCSAGTYPRLIS